MRIGSSTDTKTVYTVIALENLLMDEEGKIIHNYEMWEMSNDYESYEELTKAFVGVFDDFMYCVDNLQID